MSLPPPQTNDPQTLSSPSDGALRVLVVSHYFWPEEFRVNELTRDLRDRGHHVTVATGRPNYPGHRVFAFFKTNEAQYTLYDRNIVVERFPILGMGSSALGLILNYLSLALSMTLLAPFRFRQRSFDVIVCFQPSPFTIALPALLLGRLKRAPVVLWVLDCWPETLEALGVVRNRRALQIVGALVGYIYRRCAMVLGQSKSFGDSIRRWSRRDDLFRHFPNWVEGVYEREMSAAPSTSTAPSDEFTIVFAGNIGEAQDFPTVLDAMHALRDTEIRWLIAGGGRMEQLVRDEVVRRNLTRKVQMLGRRPVEEMPALFAMADALLVSLEAKPIFAMTVPGKVQSYMAAGKPIIGALDGEGASLIREAGCGVAVPAGDAAKLAAATEEMASASAESRSQMGNNGRNYAAKHFRRKDILDKLDRWLHEAVDQRRNGSAAGA